MKHLFVIITFLFGLVANAQEYAVKQFTVDDGLPSSHVYEVKQDKQGFYWICTNRGLTKYDGYSFEVVNSDKNSFSNDIWWTYEDQGGKLWTLSTGTNLWYLENDSFKTKALNFEGNARDISFRKIVQDNSGYYWLIVGSRFYSFKNDEFNMHRLPYFELDKKIGFPSMHYNKAGEVFFVSLGPLTIWGAGSKGKVHKLYEYDINIYGASHVLEGPGSYNEANTTLIFNTYDSLYTVRKDQLVGYYDGQIHNLGLFPSAHKLNATSYKVLKVGDKYAFINSTGSFMTNSSFVHLPEYDFMANYNINTVYEDHEGSIWISTTDQGLLYLTKDALAATSFEYIEGLDSEVVGIETDRNGVKWAAFKNGNVISYANGTLKKYFVKPINNRDKNWFLRDIKVVEGLLILAVGNYEIQVFEIDENSNIIDEPFLVNELDHNHTKTINKGTNGNLYITTFAKVYELELDKGQPAKMSIFSNQRALAASANKHGELIVSSFGGLHICKESETKLLSYDMQTKRIEPDANNNLWLILKSHGAYKVIGDTILPIKALEDIIINDVYFEEDTALWVASNNGLIQFYFDEEAREYTYNRKLTLAHGLLTNEVTSVATDSEYLYVGTTKGFNVIKRKRLSRISSGYQVLLSNVSSKGQKIGIATNYELSPDQNALEIDYVYISPKSAGHITYEYMLEGIDFDWKQTNETSVSYPFLPAGNYTFLLKAKDINGTSSSETVQLNITVNEYWWKTTWFRLTLLFVFLVSVIVIFRIRIRQLQKRERERTEMNNRIAELKLKALQSQMDPHFVFNVLNSIQEYFISNNVEAANRYLSDFSKLMRLFLDASDEKYIALNKEVKLLTLYIELERMRINNKFEYKFILAEDIELDELYVPSMLVQPLIENAIKHGLKHKEKGGRLLIEINEMENGSILIAVEDNGVGREKSKEINKTIRKDHKSKASAIITERIEIINSSTEGEINLKYIDLKDVENSACGTRAELSLNLKVNQIHVHGTNT